MGISQEKGKSLGESSGKFFDRHVSDLSRTDGDLKKGQRGGQKVSKSIPVEGSFRANPFKGK